MPFAKPLQSVSLPADPEQQRCTVDMQESRREETYGCSYQNFRWALELGISQLVFITPMTANLGASSLDVPSDNTLAIALTDDFVFPFS